MKDSYTPEALARIEEGFYDALNDARRALGHILIEWDPLLKSPRAREYLQNGVARRLGLIQRCVIKVFEICPLDRSKPFEQEELEDLNINLHAFMLNVYGILDDLAWVVLFEATQAEIAVKERKRVSLYSPDVKKHLPKKALDLLVADEKVKRWHDEYVKNFRDSLAHRIPLYVPPSQLGPEESKKFDELGQEVLEKLKSGDLKGAAALQDEQEKLGRLFPVFTHSFGDPDRSKPVYIHPQIVIDLKTVAAIVRAVSPVDVK